MNKPNRSKYTPQSTSSSAALAASASSSNPAPQVSGPPPVTGSPLPSVARRAGPPTEFTEELFSDIRAFIAAGYPIHAAAAKAGVAGSTFDKWRAAEPSIDLDIELAREAGRIKAFDAINEAATTNNNYRAWIAWLKLAFPEEYGSASQRKAYLKEKEQRTPAAAATGANSIAPPFEQSTEEPVPVAPAQSITNSHAAMPSDDDSDPSAEQQKPEWVVCEQLPPLPFVSFTELASRRR